MYLIAPCPTCGLRLQIDGQVCLTRLLSLRQPSSRRSPEIERLPSGSFDFQCPACAEPLTFHLDSPSAAA
jgi:hypothetical protein